MADMFEDAEEELTPNVVSVHQSSQPVATIASQAPASGTLPKSKQPVSQRYDDHDDGTTPSFQPEEFPSLGNAAVQPAVWPKEAPAAAQPSPAAAAPLKTAQAKTKAAPKPSTAASPAASPAAKPTSTPSVASQPSIPAPEQAFDRSKSDVLIVDAAAFIKNVPLQTMAHRLVTLADVVAEIRDAETRRRLQVLPYELELREPSSDAIKFGTCA